MKPPKTVYPVDAILTEKIMMKALNPVWYKPL